jgi:hypothetical protein
MAAIQEQRRKLAMMEAQANADAQAMQPISIEQERQMADTQARLDEAYQAAGRRAPPPLPYEKPTQFHRRLLDGLRVYSDEWRSRSINGVNDPNVLSAIEANVVSAARQNGPTYGLRPTEIKQVTKSSGAVEARAIAGEDRAAAGRANVPSRYVDTLSARDRPQQKPRQRVRACCRRHLCPEPGHRRETPLSRPETTEDVRRAGNFADADRRAEGHDAVARRDRVNPRRHGRVEATVLRCADAPSTRSWRQSARRQ